jgi:hypothetical protein
VKKIINGVTYNTETSTLVGESHLRHLQLRVTLSGDFFLYRPVDSVIVDLTLEEARIWCQDHGIKYPTEPREVGLTLRMSSVLSDRIRNLLSATDDQSVNSWVCQLIERELKRVGKDNG